MFRCTIYRPYIIRTAVNKVPISILHFDYNTTIIWPIYSSGNNPFYIQQTVPMIPKIVPQTINMSYPLPMLPPTEPNIFELRNLQTQTINMSYPLPMLPPTEPNIFELRNLQTQTINMSY
eukprot:187597_1